MKNERNNLLDYDNVWTRLRRKAPNVTAVIGFACEGAIVLASDSQMTDMDTGMKLTMQKLHLVKFKDGQEALLGIAGIVDGANLFRECFEAHAAETSISGWRTIANTAEIAIKEARAKILEGFRDGPMPPEGFAEHLNNFSCHILLAYCFDQQPHIFRLNIKSAVAVKSYGAFEAMGTGGSVAGFILSGFNLKTVKLINAMPLAVYVIEGCKRADLHCSGNTQFGYIYLNGEKGVVSFGINEKMQQSANEVQKEIEKDLSQKILEKFAKKRGMTIDPI